MDLISDAHARAECLSVVLGSFAEMQACAGRLDARFQLRFAQAAPEVRHLFARDGPGAGPGGDPVDAITLPDLVNLTAAAMGNLHAVMPVAQALAAAWAARGMRPEHYGLLGRLMIDTLTEGLPPDRYSQFLCDSWRAAYALLSGAMIAATFTPTQPVAA